MMQDQHSNQRHTPPTKIYALLLLLFLPLLQRRFLRLPLTSSFLAPRVGPSKSTTTSFPSVWFRFFIASTVCRTLVVMAFFVILETVIESLCSQTPFMTADNFGMGVSTS